MPSSVMGPAQVLHPEEEDEEEGVPEDDHFDSSVEEVVQQVQQYAGPITRARGQGLALADAPAGSALPQAAPISAEEAMMLNQQ